MKLAPGFYEGILGERLGPNGIVHHSDAERVDSPDLRSIEPLEGSRITRLRLPDEVESTIAS
jgi:hypothetical protein